MLKKFISFPFFNSLKSAVAYPAQFKLALGTGSQSFLVNFKPYEIKPDEPVVEPQEQPAFYNVYDEDEFPPEEPTRELPEEEDSREPSESNRNPETGEQKKPFRSYQKKGL